MDEALTKREEEIAAWLREGKTSEAIGKILGISRRTVEKHCEHIYEKLGVACRIEAFLKLSENAGNSGVLFVLALAHLAAGLADMAG